MRRSLIITVSYALVGGPCLAIAQFDDSSPGPRLSLNQFLTAVAANNVDLAAQRYNVTIAQAQVVAARVSPNPIASFFGTRDVSNKQQPSTENGGLSETIEAGGKRRFHVSVAANNLLAASATLEDFFRNLRGSAAISFVDAVASDKIVQQKRRAFGSLSQLADLNRIRFEQGDIAEVDYNQALVDSFQARADAIAAETTARTAAFALIQLLGKPSAPEPRPTSELTIPDRKFDLAILLQHAMQTRPDVLAARHAHESALASVNLAKANRLPDVTLSTGLQQNESGHNPINPSPNFNLFNFGVSMPSPVL